METKPTEVVATVEEEQPGVDEIALASVNRVAMTRPVALDVLAMRDPKVVANYITNRVNALQQIRKTALASTTGTDWVLFKNKEGQVTAMLKKSGAERVRPWYGIEVRPRGEVDICVEDGQTFAVIMGDAFCPITGGVQEGIVGRRGQGEQFTGRDKNVAGLGDLKSAARANLDTKAVRILCGMSSVALSELSAAWGCSEGDAEKRCSRGSGYGTSAERTGKAPQKASPASAPQLAQGQGGAPQNASQPAPSSPAVSVDGQLIRDLCKDLYGDQIDWQDFGDLIRDAGGPWKKGMKWAEWVASLTVDSAAKILDGLQSKLGLATSGPREPGQEG